MKSLKTLGITTSPRALKFMQSRIPLELQWESQHLPLSVKEEQMQLFTCTLPGLCVNCSELKHRRALTAHRGKRPSDI